VVNNEDYCLSIEPMNFERGVIRRERLAKIVLSLMPDTHNPVEIQAIALQEMTKGD
jgi:hypothetical protein